MYKLLFGLLFVAMAFSCQKETGELVDEQVQETSFLKSGTAITTLEQLQNSSAGTLTDVPAGQDLLEDEWDYQNVYHFETNTGETHEIYTFEPGSEELDDALTACDKVYTQTTEKNGTTTTTCAGHGNQCRVVVLDNCGSVCISVCVSS